MMFSQYVIFHLLNLCDSYRSISCTDLVAMYTEPLYRRKNYNQDDVYLQTGRYIYYVTVGYLKISRETIDSGQSVCLYFVSLFFV